MALVLKLRPQERVVVNGALIRNASDHAISLHLLNRASLLHERDILLPEEAKTPLSQLYMLVQALLLDGAGAEGHRKQFVHLAAKIYAKALGAKDNTTCGLIADLIRLVSEDNFYKALRLLKPSIGVDASASRKAATQKARQK
jgi:flagellar protein FlbT